MGVAKVISICVQTLTGKLPRKECKRKSWWKNAKYCRQFAALRLPWDVKHVRYLSVSRNSGSFTFYNFSSHKTSTNLRLDFRPAMDDFSRWQMWRSGIPVILVWRGKESFLNFGEILSGANLLKRDAAACSGKTNKQWKRHSTYIFMQCNVHIHKNETAHTLSAEHYRLILFENSFSARKEIVNGSNLKRWQCDF